MAAYIGGAAVSGIIEKLVDASYTAIKERFLPAGDIETALERLHDALPQIKAVLSAIEFEWDEIKNQNEALVTWMWQLRDVVDYADDVLDEMTYYDLEKEIQSHNQKVNPFASNSKRKFLEFASTFLEFASSSKRKFLEFVGSKFEVDNHGISSRLAIAVKRLDKVVSSVHNFLYLGRGSSRFHGKNYEKKKFENDRETGSMITENVVFGREKERDSIVEWLTTGPSNGDATLSAFTIYGIGGVGKTTLAQLIYKDERVSQFFHPIIWVCVSDQFDAVTIITKILQVMPKEPLTVLQDNLKERLMSKRFLLVLDDVWNDENRYQWEKLVAPLKFGQGKILVTTRMESVVDMVAKVIEGKTDCLKLDGLEEKEFFMLFNHHAFDGADPDEFRNLYPIGKQIAKKLGGCPLAAKIIGGVLNYSIEFEYWNKVLKEDVPDFRAGKDGIMGVLRLSYFHLPTYLQLCFRYCSIFPKDYGFTKDELIKMWIGSGLIQCKRQIVEDVGREYFNRLVRKSFIDFKSEIFYGMPDILHNLKSEKLYVIHDLLHDLAQSVSEGECLGVEGSSPDISRTTIRHLSFNMKNLLAIREISHLKSLRTLFITFQGDNPESGDIKLFGEVLERLKSLRLLRIKITWKGEVKVPDAIGELIHLRYLSYEFAIGKLHWFPMSVYKLYHLELIKFEASILNDMETLDVKGIVNLINLRHLDVGSEILKKISSIGKLTSLQKIEPFSIELENGHMISELRDLRSLRKLAITNLEKVSNPIEGKEAKLNVKENLNNLSLRWSQGNSIITQAEYEELLDKLEPHKHLQELVIDGYGGMKFPVWITDGFLVNLISLNLCCCVLLESLPTLGNLPLLKELHLYRLCQVKKIGQSFYGNGSEIAFPLLKVLTLSDMEELEDWDEVRGMILFPRLETLDVSDCPKLRRLHSLPPSLKKLDIDNVGLEILPIIYPSCNNGITAQSSLYYLKVKGCSNLTSLDGCLLRQQEGIFIGNCLILTDAPDTQQNVLPSSHQELTIGQDGLDVPLHGSVQNTTLTELYLDDCPCISSLPPFKILATLIALNSLNISYCPNLSSLGGLEALSSLRYLFINNCDKLITMSLSQPSLSANANNSNPLQLNELHIDRASLLLLEPLRSLRLTKSLRIIDASGLTCMPEEWLLQNRSTLYSIYAERATNLEQLPSFMDKLQLLEHLKIYDAPSIQSIPDLPSSLNYLCITRCHPMLKERYKKGGPEWHRIAFISDVLLL